MCGVNKPVALSPPALAVEVQVDVVVAFCFPLAASLSFFG
jgi:hypothetical protein